MNDKKDDQITMLNENALEQVAGGLNEPSVPGAQQGPEPSPASRTGCDLPPPYNFADSIGMACWKSNTMVHVFKKGERGELVCIYCGCAKPF